MVGGCWTGACTCLGSAICSIANTTRRCRSYVSPRDFEVHDPRTWLGNLFADLSIFLLHVAKSVGTAAWDGNPKTSIMRKLPSWVGAVSKSGYEVAEFDICAFGSPGRHNLLFCITLAIRSDSTIARARASTLIPNYMGALLPIQDRIGPPWRQRGVYASMIMLTRSAPNLQTRTPSKIDHARPYMNVLCESSKWTTERRWRWTRPGHINLLEQRVAKRFLKQRIRDRMPGRHNLVQDSRVTICSGVKGRSVSRALNHQCRSASPFVLGNDAYIWCTLWSYSFQPI